MNPYKILKGTLRTLAFAAPFALFAGVEACYWGFGGVAEKDAQKKFDDFTQSEIFQAFKAEEEANLTAMKNELEIAQQQQSKGQLSTRAYLDMKNEYDKKVESVNSEDFVLSTMKKYGPYDDWAKSANAVEACRMGGIVYSVIGPIGSVLIGSALADNDTINGLFLDEIKAYDEKRRFNCAMNGNCATNRKTEKPLER